MGAEQVWAVEQKYASHRCVCTRPISQELLEHCPQELEQGGCAAVQYQAPERLGSAETIRAFPKRVAGYLGMLSSRWWGDQVQGVVFNFTKICGGTSTSPSSAVEGHSVSWRGGCPVSGHYPVSWHLNWHRAWV